MREKIFKKPPVLLRVGKNKSDFIPAEAVSPADIVFFGRSGATLKIGDYELSPVSGDIVVVSRQVSYSADVKDLPAGGAIFVTIDGAEIYGDYRFTGESGFRIVSSGIYRGILEAAFRQLWREQDDLYPESNFVSDNLLNIILALTTRLMPFEIRPRKSSEVVGRAKEYFDENFLNDETLSDACKKLNLDRYYLSHVFRRQTGMPPKKYLIEKRLEYAEQLLRMTDDDIIVIAKRCGYDDPAYFCRLFKQTRGRTALEYRANYKKKKAEEEKQKK